MGDASKRIGRGENVDAGSEQISADEQPKISAMFSTVDYQKLVVEKNKMEVRATNAELRIAELEKLLKAKEDECAMIIDLLVELKRETFEIAQRSMKLLQTTKSEI
ncbi:hypothetical protein V6N13_033301 [Hibiscus sabdariffa]|uniref:RAB6-interacting golgin n=1 Tax=Hibiscus sabdariffa TaxID=183260 RepID=A0ABR2FAW0_9ROSI